MNFDWNNPSAPGGGTDPFFAFHVVVAYEDFHMGKHALDTLTRLFPPRDREFSYGTDNVWKFDLLETGRFCDIAVEEAAKADIVFISARGSGDLPPGVRRWMERWIKRRERDGGALALLMDGSSADRTKGLLTEIQVKEYAMRSGMDFFVQRVNQGRTGGPPDLPANAVAIPQSFQLLGKIMRRREGFQARDLDD